MKLLHMKSLFIISSNTFLCEGLKHALLDKKKPIQIIEWNSEKTIAEIITNYSGAYFLFDMEIYNSHSWTYLASLLKIKNHIYITPRFSIITNDEINTVRRSIILSILPIEQIFDFTLPVKTLIQYISEWLEEKQSPGPLKKQVLREHELLTVYKTLSGKKINEQAEEEGHPVKTIYSRRKSALNKLGCKNIRELIESV
ncbi:TPA: hypothetical protein PP061_003921 [Salmonella bongori]|uniref:Uncharacterized protein n=1 Tax=Salmonella bongori N268-08 TaxID=1197719 RepID=S5N501_SALBN|nr:hypothetical protein [Salmonella bongori]AGR61944.1 hypothetical protein A464_plas0120 [Salmonella bongori N268-08]EDP8577926.1 hypothetical protein [Salmonella bongori]EDP8595396.1 hypothetical protein [Salmonella bongori]EDP8599870.1 hypothetical protein [Salmonella bongori]EDP8686962.1 hypothetical protein [Salmonella bongori]